MSITHEQLSEIHDSAYGWALNCCGRDRDLAAEVLQQAYCRILAGDATLNGNSEFSTWVFGVVRYVAYEELRRRKKQGELFRPIAPIASETGCNHVDIEHHELVEQLGAALDRLSPRQREVLHLTFYQGLTIEQAAEVLEITIGSARKHYQRGKDTLRRILVANQEMKR